MIISGARLSGVKISGTPSVFIGDTSNTQTPTLGSGTSISTLTGVSSPTSPFSGVTMGAYNLNNSVNGYFTVPASTDWAFGTGDFTVEGWVFSTAASNSNFGFFDLGTANSGGSLALFHNSGI